MGEKLKRLKKILFRLFLTVILLLLVLCGTILYILSDKGSTWLREGLKKYDVYAQWQNSSWHFPFHFTLEDFSLHTRNIYDFPSFHAERLKISFLPGRIFRGVFFPVTLQVANGRLLIPVFPEKNSDKKPAEEELLKVTDLQLDLKGIPGEVKVNNFSGRIGKGEFILSGTIDNFLHAAGAAFFGALQDSLLQDPAKEKRKDIKSLVKGLFSFQLSLDTREDLLGLLQELRKENGSLPFLLHSKFHLDCNHSFRNRMEGVFSMEGFQWRKVRFLPFHETFILSGGIFELNKFTVRTPNGDSLTFSGRYNGKKDLVSGRFSGSSTPLLWKKLIPPLLPEIVKKLPLSYGDILHYSGEISSWKIGERDTLTGKLSLKLPRIHEKNGIQITGGILNFNIKNGAVKGDFSCDKIHKNGLSGKTGFTFDRSVDGDMTFTLSASVVAALLREYPPFKANLPSGLHLPPKGNIMLSLEYVIPGNAGEKPRGVLTFSLPSLQYETLPFRNIKGIVEIREEQLYFRSLEVWQENMLLEFTGEVLLQERCFQGNIRILGGPGKAAAKFLAKRGGSIGKYLLDNLSFPEKGNLAEFAGNFFYRSGKGKLPPFWYWDGTLVMEDFSWQKMPFTYFAGRLLMDSKFYGAVQGATLQSKNGEAVISLLYDPNKGKNGGSFQWELKSHLTGNEILRSLLPDHPMEDFDFPGAVPFSLAGTAYLSESGKDFFRGTVTNGSFLWRGFPFSQMDALMEYKNETLYIKNAVGRAAGGRVSFSYSYNFPADKGRLEVQLENGNLTPVLKVLKTDFQGLNTSRAKISGRLTTEISAQDNSPTALLNGRGSAVVLGDDLWKIPIFGEILNILGKTWNTYNLGSITRVDADFSLSGTKFIANKIRSNGSVVGIQMNGYYDWDKEDLDFRIRSELLRGTLPFEAMSKVLSPVSWILEKRLRGKGVQHKWQWFIGDQPAKKKK